MKRLENKFQKDKGDFDTNWAKKKLNLQQIQQSMEEKFGKN